MPSTRFILTGLLLWPIATAASAQVLARPGWIGSGVLPEPWWHGAVLYRLDPARFQDSGNTGAGDLAGAVARMDYLQSLGVDALLLDGRWATDPLFDHFLRAASQHRLRLLLAVSPALQTGDPQILLRTVHDWLSAGAAGIYLDPVSSGSARPAPGAASSLQPILPALTALLQSFPGERLLVTGTPDIGVPHAPGDAASRPAVHHGKAAAPLSGGRGGVLTEVAALPTDPPGAAPLNKILLEERLRAAGADPPLGTQFLLRFAGDPPTASPDAIAAAALLLTSRSGALFSFGDEIGLRTSAPAGDGPVADSGSLPVMQWTPSNAQAVTPAPIERVTPTGPVYGPYHPYVHPPPESLTGPPPAVPRVSLDGDIPAKPPAPDTLPGFTTGPLPHPPVDGDRINVASEDRDPRSILNAYRQLLALHHGNATLRNGAEVVLHPANGEHPDAGNAVVVLRRAPPGSRTGADVLIAVNLGATPAVLSLNDELGRLGAHLGALRPLFTSAPETSTGETTGNLRLSPHAVFVGELPRTSVPRALGGRRR